MVRFVVTEPGLLPRRLDLGEGVHDIGRSASSAFVIPARDVSVRHAELDLREGRVVVRDLDSKNGTWVNGTRVKECALLPGDVLRIGSARLMLDAPAPAAGSGQAAEFVPASTHDTIDAASTENLDEVLAAGRAEALHAAPYAEQRLRMMLKVAQMLSDPLELDDLLARTLDVLARILEIGRGAIVLLDPANGALDARVVRGSAGAEKLFSSTAVRWVCEQRRAVLFADVPSGPIGVATSMGDAVVSAMCAPLLARDELHGAIYVDNSSTSRRFTDDDLALLSAFASQAALAIGNTFLQARITEEEVLQNTMARFFPPATVRRLRESGGGGLETIETEVTVLFSDITDFTGLSGRLEPSQVVALLNEYFPVMAEIVFRHEGTLEKYIGDALLAMWGAPYASGDDADRAVRAAVEMQRALGELNQRLSASGREPIGVHIGLNTGRVAAGNIGSADYIQYATIGDATNVAARVCNKATDGEILISEATRERLHAAPCGIEHAGTFVPKGKEEPVTVYRLRWDRPPTV